MMCTFEEDANLFVDGELDARSQAEFFRHLAACSECQSFIDMSLRVRELRRKEAVTFPSEIDEAVFARIAAQSLIARRARRIAREKVPFWHRSFSLPLPMVGATAVIIILVGFILGAFLLRQPAAQSTQALGLGTGQTPTVIVIYPMPPVDVIGKATVQKASKPEPIRN